MENLIFAWPEKAMQKPYKTNRILPLVGQKCEKRSKNIEKALPREGFENAFSRWQKTL